MIEKFLMCKLSTMGTQHNGISDEKYNSSASNAPTVGPQSRPAARAAGARLTEAARGSFHSEAEDRAAGAWCEKRLWQVSKLRFFVPLLVSDV